LMYLDKKIVMSGIIEYTFHNPDVAKYIWESSDEPFEYIFCFDDVHLLDIPSSKVLIKEFGYKNDFIMGANPLADDRLKKVLDEYGSIENFRKEIESENRDHILYSSNSWRILQENIFLKIIDKSVLHNNGTGIPKDIIKYFKMEDIEQGNNQEIIFNYNNKNYYARIEHISSDRYRIMWRQDFANILKEQLPFWYKKLGEDSSYGSDQERPKLKFYKKNNHKYKVEIIKENTNINYRINDPNIWWVNQGQTLSSEQEEGVLWAPISNKNGSSEYHWETMTEVKAGDIILHYANGALRYVSRVVESAIQAQKPESIRDPNENWERQGRLLKTEYYKLEPAIDLNIFNDEIVELGIKKGPINKNGRVNQGYLFYFNKEGLKIIQKKQPETDWPQISKINGDNMTQRNLSTKNIISEIKSYIKNKGYTYPKYLIENFYLSLKTKPFVLLAGISGTGKTKLVELFAEAIDCTEENEQFKLISVKPDWNDSSDLLGYNNIRGDFQPGPLLKTIKHAIDHPEKPHIVCLDEMNLARVEYYFSEFLSKMETRRFISNKIKTDRLLTVEDFDKKDEESIKKYADIFIPDNLYIVGTVNMDETTHPFSKKVLDRANTIEFNEIELMAYQDNIDSSPDTKNISLNNEFLRPQFLSLKDTLPEYKSLVDEITAKLVEINKILNEVNLPVGYRIRDEINFYIIEALNNNILNKNIAFDKQITQKILPRIQGSSRMIKTVLVKLFKFTSDKDFTKENGDLGEKMLKYYQDNKENIKYPYSTKKIVYMLKRYEEDGFTAYWL
ncbi:MAG: McrB family protein, partial [bacterium]